MTNTLALAVLLLVVFGLLVLLLRVQGLRGEIAELRDLLCADSPEPDEQQEQQGIFSAPSLLLLSAMAGARPPPVVEEEKEAEEAEPPEGP